MAGKEASIYIIDVGSSMGNCHNGRTKSDLDWSSQYLWDKISTTTVTALKSRLAGVVGINTDKSDNPMGTEPGYENISIFQELEPMDIPKLRALRTTVKPNRSSSGDCISATVLAIEMMQKVTKKLKYKRRIYLITNGRVPVDEDDVRDIAAKITEVGIELFILGVDFDDAQFGFKEEEKDEVKAKTERTLKDLAEKSGGTFATMAEAIEQLGIPEVRHVTSHPKSYAGPLTIGNPDMQPDAISINVERYAKTKKASVPTAKTVVIKRGEGNGSQSTAALDREEMQIDQPENGGFAGVSNARTYKVKDPDAPGGERDVPKDSLASGYTYGRTVVHIDESDRNITKLDTESNFSVIGFVHQEKYDMFLSTGPAFITIAAKTVDAAALKLSSFIHSLHELESYAIARIVPKPGNAPQLVLLAPHIDVDLECLYDVPLPFAEDVRNYQFPPLDKVVTVTGTTLIEHRNLPSKDLTEAMSDFVDAMDISTYEPDDNGERKLEYVPIDDVFSVPLHRINQIIKHRAAYPDQPVPPTQDILVKYAQPPSDLVESARTKIEDLIDVAQVKKVPPKAKAKREKQTVVPISGLDIDALLRAPEYKSSRAKINPINAVAEFKQMISQAEDEAELESAVRQMGDIARQLVTDSLGDSNYERVIEHMRIVRETAVNFEEPRLYNTFVVDFKQRLLSGSLAGDRRELWWLVKGARLGLIDSTTSEVSSVKPDEAVDFYKNNATYQTAYVA